MPKILFVWNIALSDGNIGSYKPSVYAAHMLHYDIDVAMNFTKTPIQKRTEIEKGLGIRLINVEIDRNPYSLKNKAAYNQLVNIIKESEYDIIHCNTPMGGILGRLAARKCGIKKVFYMNRGFAFYKGAPLKNWVLYYSIEKIFARLLTDAIATINNDDFVYAKKIRLRRNSNLKFSLPGPGVELSRFEFSSEDRENVRKEYGFEKDDIVVLSVGEICERKNFGVIIEAFNKIHKTVDYKGLFNRLYYLIVGDGELKEELERKVEEYGLESKIIFAGYHDDVSKFYSASDLYALPSKSEGFGRVGIEAMNVGLPLITSDVQGINLYSINGKTGFKYNSMDVDGFMKGIIALSTEEDLRKRISLYNRKFAKSFSIENSAAKIAEIYKALMEYQSK